MSAWPYGSGGMAARIRAHDWSATPLGPIGTWPQSLRTVVDLMLGSDVVMAAPWGEREILLYNDAYSRLIGERTRVALGRPAFEAFPELRPVLGPQVAEARAGRTVQAIDQFYPFVRTTVLEDAWFDVCHNPVRGEDGTVAGILTFLTETTSRVQAERRRRESEAVLRGSEERQAFLLELSDTLRPLVDARDIKGAAAAVASQWLDIASAGYAEVEAGGLTAVITDEYNDGRIPSLTARYVLKDFSSVTEPMKRGETIHFADLDGDGVSPDTKAAFAAINVRAAVATPLIKSGAMVAYLFVAHPEPRIWTTADLDLLGEVAERTWAAVERARAEAALRESEERFAQFANASSGGIWVRDARTFAMEYASPAIGRIYGVAAEAVGGGIANWAAMILPDDRDAALELIERARQGKSVVQEFRIQRPSDQIFRWIRDTCFPLGGDGTVRRIGGISEDVTEAKLAIEHQAVLLAELQHRVRNIMAMIRSITARTGERADSVQGYADLMMGRLLALARVQALLTRAANVSVGIRSIVLDEVGVQAQHEGQYVLDGPDVMVSPKAAEVLTLAIHELATNALKYGALSVAHGQVAVTWSTFERRGTSWLRFDWTEQGAPVRPRPTPDAPRRRGFGSELIEGRVPYELRGKGKVTVEPGGARCHLEFPLGDGASILETDAPPRATVFGGALDMTGEADLSGHRILIVEDDYYLATDAARAFQGTGAEVMGPFSTEDDARAELDDRLPDAAVVDINLGLGPSFRLAGHLKDRGIPFVFTTGYDPEVIPAGFEGVERLQKPVQLRQIVGAVSRLITSTA